LTLDAQVVLNSRTTLLIDAREPGPLQKAARDLASDLEKVFGKPARIVHQPSEASRTTLCVAFRYNAPSALAPPTGRETLSIQAIGQPWSGSPVDKAIVLTGSDLRGAIYAVYEFSQKFLEVDPLYWWTDHAPPRRDSVRVPDRFHETQGPPTFRYRGWFINDEDLLTGWRPGTADGAGIALETWDKLFEALLRLKGNMIVPGTFLFPYEPQVRAAGERGLIVTQHHIEVLGLNTYRWPDDKPYSFFSHPDLLVDAWTRAVKQYGTDQEAIWTLGYRGRHDRPFWTDDKGAPSNDADRARAIRAAIDRQTEIVRREQPQPYFLMNAWMEAVPLIQQGLLKIPEGVTLVWPDNGHGLIRDEGAISRGQGVYYHTAMYNSRANQLTEMVPPERIRRELGRAAKAGATEYMLVNTSDFRPVAMTTREVMELAWNAKPWIAEDLGQGSVYLRKWSREEFGERAAAGVAEFYRAYFEAPARFGGREDQVLGDNYYHTLSRDLLVRLIKEDTTSPIIYLLGITGLREYASQSAAICREANPRWEKVRLLAKKAETLIPPARRNFFQSHVLTQLAIHQYSNRMLMNVADAALADSPSDKLVKLDAAINDIQSVLKAFRAAEYGQWAGFYRGDLFVNVRHTLALVEAYRGKLQGRNPPPDLRIALRPEDPYVPIKAYQGKQRVQF
jgi:hypothetical protein